MLFKFTIVQLMTFILIQHSLASPIVDPGKYNNEVKSPSEKITKEIEDSLKSVSTSAQWIVQSLLQLSSNIFAKIFVNMSKAFISAILRLELYSMAAGSHIIFPEMASSEREHQHRITAIATHKLTLNLKDVGKIHDILTKTSEKTAAETLHTGLFDKSMEIFYSELDSEIELDEHLSKDYIAEKMLAEQQTYPPMGKQIMKINDTSFNYNEFRKLLSEPVVLSMIVTKLFLQTASKHVSLLFSKDEFDRYITARWMLEHKNINQFDKIYKEAVETTTKLINPDYDTDEIVHILFKHLNALIEKDHELKNQLHDYKETETKLNFFDEKFLRIDLIFF